MGSFPGLPAALAKPGGIVQLATKRIENAMNRGAHRKGECGALHADLKAAPGLACPAPARG